jgi:hypothetical protein
MQSGLNSDRMRSKLDLKSAHRRTRGFRREAKQPHHVAQYHAAYGVHLSGQRMPYLYRW